MQRFNPLSLALLFALLTAPGCFTFSDDGTDAAAPRITLFEVSPDAIPEGGVATLRWTTTGADELRLTTADGTALDLAGQAPAAGQLEVEPGVSTAYNLVALGNGSASQSVTLTVTAPQQPEILGFTASASDVYAGSEITLSWQTRGATDLTLQSDAGESVVVARADVASGTAGVSVDGDVVWTLTAASKVGQVTADLSVATAAPPVIESFTVTPSAAVNPGDEILLAWAVTGATGLELSSLDGTVIQTGLPLAGTTSLFPEHAETYVLTAEGALGDVSESLEVAVRPVVVSFTASPTSTLPGETVTLDWFTRGATGVQISGPEGFAYNATPDAVQVGRTTFTAAAPGTFVLTARSGDLMVTAALDLEVLLPTIDSFGANPLAIAAGGSTTLSWTARGGTTLEVQEGIGGQVIATATTTFDPASLTSGSVTVSPTVATSYLLHLHNDRGDVATETVFVDIVQGPVVASFTATPAQVLRGEWIDLGWSVTDDQLGASPTLGLTDDRGTTYDVSGASQNQAAFPIRIQWTGTTTFTLTATTPGMPPFVATTTVESFGPARVDAFQASPSSLDTQGGTLSPTSTLSWNTQNAQSLQVFALDAAGNRIVPALYTTSVASVVASGSVSVQPSITTGYRVIATGALGSTASGDLSVAVLPELLSFTTSATTIAAGGSVTLSWDSHAATSAQLTRRNLSGGSSVNQAVAVSGSLPLSPTTSQEYTLCVSAGGADDCQVRIVRVVQAGALKISEIMMDPAAVTDDMGEWFEVVNTGTEPVDLAGWTLEDHRAAYVLPATPLLVAPGGYLVFTRRPDSATNGGVTPDHTYGTVLSLRNTDGRLALVLDGVAMDTVVWDGANGWTLPTGGSLALQASRFAGSETNNDTPADWCLSSVTYGAGDLGTPGSAPVACGSSGSSYTLTENAGIAFVDIANTGTLLANVDGDDVYGQAPNGLGFTMPFFGSSVSELWVSTNGFLSFQSPGNSGVTNTTLPSTSGPNSGLVAPFWDDLNVQLAAQVNYQTTGTAGSRRTIVQWTGFTRYGQSGTLTFQVQLFENGDIALVYQQATGSTGFDGSQATVGIEAIGGTEGVLHGYNQLGAISAGDSILFERQ